MIAPVDMPVGVSSYPGQHRRPEYVINTPYHRANEDNRFRYRFVDGFYESEKSTFTNPIVQLRRNELMRHVQQVVGRFSSVIEKFTEVDQKILAEVSAKLLIVLVLQGFTKVTFEKTPDDSLMATGEWTGKLVYIDIFFDPEEPAGYEAILNVYEQKRPILNTSGTLDSIFTELFGGLPAWWEVYNSLTPEEV